MSNKLSKKDDNTNKKSKRTFIVSIIIILLITTVCIESIILLSNTTKNNNNTNEVKDETVETDDKTSEDTEIDNEYKTTYELSHKILEGSDKEQAINNMRKNLESMRTKNFLTQLMTDTDTWQTYLLNNKGESFTYSSDGSVMTVGLNNGNYYLATPENISYGENQDLLEMLDNVIEVASEDRDDVKVLEMEINNEGHENCKEYRIDMTSSDAIRKTYSLTSEEYADSMMEQINQIEETGWKPEFIYVITLHEDQLLASCLVVQDNTEYYNWYYDGILDVDEWEISEDWYKADYEKISENIDTFEQMFSSISSDMDKFIGDMADKYGWEKTDDTDTTDDSVSDNSFDISDIADDDTVVIDGSIFD